MSALFDKMDAWADFFGDIGPFGDAYGEAEDATRRRVSDAIRDSIKPFVQGDEVRLPGTAWIVSGRP